MLRFLTDEDFDEDIVRGVRSRLPAVDVVRVVDIGLCGRTGGDDPAVLARAAADNRVVLTHDRNTMTAHANDRLKLGLEMSGVFVVSRQVPIGRVIEDLVTLHECSEPSEWADRVEFIPF